MSSFSTVLTRLGLDEHAPLLASEIAQDLVSGARTIAIHDYALPAWALDVDIAVVEQKGDDAGVIVGVVRFGEDIDYASDDASFTRDAALHGASENLGTGLGRPCCAAVRALYHKTQTKIQGLFLRPSRTRRALHSSFCTRSTGRSRPWPSITLSNDCPRLPVPSGL